MALLYTSGLGLINPAFGGSHSTPVGTTKRTGTPDAPTRVRVALFDQPSGRMLREMWSDETTGAYQFHQLRAGTYFVVTFDHTGAYNGETTTDIVVPAP